VLDLDLQSLNSSNSSLAHPNEAPAIARIETELIVLLIKAGRSPSQRCVST
jgi:hypothetical protein